MGYPRYISYFVKLGDDLKQIESSAVREIRESELPRSFWNRLESPRWPPTQRHHRMTRNYIIQRFTEICG